MEQQQGRPDGLPESFVAFLNEQPAPRPELAVVLWLNRQHDADVWAWDLASQLVQIGTCYVQAGHADPNARWAPRLLSGICELQGERRLKASLQRTRRLHTHGFSTYTIPDHLRPIVYSSQAELEDRIWAAATLAPDGNGRYLPVDARVRPDRNTDQ